MAIILSLFAQLHFLACLLDRPVKHVCILDNPGTAGGCRMATQILERGKSVQKHAATCAAFSKAAC